MTRWLYDHMESHSEDYTDDGENEAVLFTFKEQPVKLRWTVLRQFIAKELDRDKTNPPLSSKLNIDILNRVLKNSTRGKYKLLCWGCPLTPVLMTLCLKCVAKEMINTFYPHFVNFAIARVLCSSEKHFLHFKFTVLSKGNTFLTFSAEAVADGKRIFHYNNKDKSWVRSSLTKDDWTESPSGFYNSSGPYQTAKTHYALVSFMLDSSIIRHVRKTGCELEKFPNGTMNLTDTAPDVHIFVRKVPDDHSKLNLTCLATGFYPRDIKMNIRLYRLIIKNQTSSKIRPNADGSFQMRTNGNCADCETKSHWALKAVLISVSIILVLICYCIYKRRRSNDAPNNRKEASPENMTLPQSSAVHSPYFLQKINLSLMFFLERSGFFAALLDTRPSSKSLQLTLIYTVYCHECCSVIVKLHVLQRKTGCELEKFPNGTMNLTVFDEYGFDGEDFLAFNSDTLQWIDKNTKANKTKMKWDQQTKCNEHLQLYLKECKNWISTFDNMKKSPPDVHVFVRKDPDDHSNLNLTCLATGFYPRDVQMNIRLYRLIVKDQISSEIRPNTDGSFQMRTTGNCDACKTESRWALKAVLISVLILVLIVIWYCIYKRRRSKGVQMSSQDDENGVKMRLNSDRGETSSPESKRREWYNKNGSSPHTDMSISQSGLRCKQFVYCRS
ncbi:hypothetical protein H4Q32_006651 [Labeo rohita]|uniref:MHC class I-like antigen recognition-like domain-containing protein n=1 Tax=Labeo rohita TaxID=84645 RepID=A0ABQ8LRI9_LABRO|nr:hypothetical protein H4Q32_006651 [Labeo rohita]